MISPIATIDPTGDTSGMFPVITASPTDSAPGSIAPGQDPRIRQLRVADNSTMPGGMPIAAAQVLGLGLLMMAGLLATTRLTVRRRSGKPGQGGKDHAPRP
ncbi:MAG: hypothetical protein JO345_05135 [Streptosporangiaceae bacterium]|nr:hypothetical protein [Streptosporangiaceae bacterium]